MWFFLELDLMYGVTSSMLRACFSRILITDKEINIAQNMCLIYTTAISGLTQNNMHQNDTKYFEFSTVGKQNEVNRWSD